MKKFAIYFIIYLCVIGFSKIAASEKGSFIKEIQVKSQAKTMAKKTERGEQGGFVLGPEDVLEISVWKDETLTKQVVIRPDGKISFPLIGEIQAAGRTVEDLRKEIIEKLSEFISDPVVTVMVIGINSYKIYVIGKVNKPGAYTVGRPVNVMQALSMAGGFSPFADLDNISILREQNGKQIRIKFNYKEVAKGKHLEENILLKRGDVIVVP